MKKWLFGIPLGVLLLLVIYGASQMKSTPTGQQRYDLYFLSDSYTSGSALDTESCTLDSEKDVVNQLVHALLSKPKHSELTSPFPKGTTLLSARLKDGVLTLNFSKEYGDLTGAKRTLANGAVVLTMTQLKQVDSVVILAVGESVLPGKSEEPLTAEDFDLSGMSADPIPLKTTLYFPSEDGTQVLHETRTLQAATTNQTSAIQAVLDALCAGPERKGAAAYLPATSDGVTIRLEKTVCALSLPDQWMQALLDENGKANLAAWALSASLTQLDGVSQVSYWNDGGEIPGLSAKEIKKVYTVQ